MGVDAGKDRRAGRETTESVNVTKSENRIVGIVLAKNEDRFIERAIENAAGFCDHWIFADHGSSDQTPAMMEKWASQLPSAEFHRIGESSESHELLQRYVGEDHWVFGLDGDEVYDPRGLARLRRRILDGEFASQWMILGHALHVTEISDDYRWASGHASPPCRSMTKLYNFSAISAWGGYCPERLHGGTPVFRGSYGNELRAKLHETGPWTESDFRCLHLCFLSRSSLDGGSGPRANLMDIQGSTKLSRWISRWGRWFGWQPGSRWKDERYRRGELQKVDAAEFFLPTSAPGC